MPVEQRQTAKRARARRHSAKRAAALQRVGKSARDMVGRWRRICARDGWVCQLCKGRIDPALRPPHRRAGSVDHIQHFVSEGGSDDDANLRAAHIGCNSRDQKRRTHS